MPVVVLLSLVVAAAPASRNVTARELPEQPYGAAVEERGEIELPVSEELAWKRFVLRYPKERARWNRAVVVGAHGGSGGEAFRRDGRVLGTDETALDDVVGAHALRLGFAYASFDRDGVGGSREGLALTHAFTEAAKSWLVERMGRGVERAYLAGLSMGGGIARYAAEEDPPRFDGVLIVAGAHGDVDTRRKRQSAMAELWPHLEPGLPDDDPRVLAYAEAVGTPVAARRFWPFLGSTTSAPGGAADGRADATGRLLVPAIEVVGTFDDFVVADVRAYRRKVEARGYAGRHRAYFVEGAWHISGDDDAISSFQFAGTRVGLSPETVDAMATGASYLPAVRDALELLESWVNRGVAPPPGRTVVGDAGLGISPHP